MVIYGGAAGGGKTWGLLMEPLRHIHNPDFGAVIFRRTSPQITNQGGLWDQSSRIYPLLGAEPKLTTLEWTFPSGARVRFGHLQYEKDKYEWQGAQIPLLGFDELTHLSETQFFYMLSRNRSTCGVRPYVRATTNPDADSWVAKMVDWWIGEDGYPIPERAGVVRYFVRVGEELRWGDTPEEASGDSGIAAKSFTFIPARLDDNPALLKANPEYRANLLALPYVDRERLLGGNWHVRPEAGKVFNRGWFQIVEAVPRGGVECLFWDFASTRKEIAKDDPDYTAAVRMREVKGTWYVMDVFAEQMGPADVERAFVNLSRQGAQSAAAGGARFLVRWEVEPGSAGRREAVRLTRLLAGLDARGVPSQGDKLARAKALAAQSEAGNVKLLGAAWNDMWLNHMHSQPTAPHNDIMDASAGAFNALSQRRGRRAHGSHRG